MKVFVTGGAGYIGSVATEKLLDAGHETIVFDSLERGHRAAVDTRARFVEGDLRDWERIRSVMSEVKPDAVMHFAAYALVPESMKQPEIYFRNNVVGAANLAEAMLRAGVQRIVFSSTCATYGQPERVPITEDTPQRPTNPYGESKLAFEKMLAWYHQLHGMNTIYLRYFNASGATAKFGEDHEPETHLIPNVMRVALGKMARVCVYGDDYETPDGTCLRDYIHIEDLAQAHILALQCPQSGPFNLGTGTGNSVKEVIDAVREVTGHAIPVEVHPRRAGDPPRLVAAADKAHNVLGWKPRYSGIRDIVRSAWDWHQRNPNGYRRA
jgi:UDP-glucose 4-epimerase